MFKWTKQSIDYQTEHSEKNGLFYCVEIYSCLQFKETVDPKMKILTFFFSVGIQKKIFGGMFQIPSLNETQSNIVTFVGKYHVQQKGLERHEGKNFCAKYLLKCRPMK